MNSLFTFYEKVVQPIYTHCYIKKVVLSEILVSYFILFNWNLTNGNFTQVEKLVESLHVYEHCFASFASLYKDTPEVEEAIFSHRKLSKKKKIISRNVRIIWKIFVVEFLALDNFVFKLVCPEVYRTGLIWWFPLPLEFPFCDSRLG